MISRGPTQQSETSARNSELNRVKRQLPSEAVPRARVAPASNSDLRRRGDDVREPMHRRSGESLSESMVIDMGVLTVEKGFAEFELGPCCRPRTQLLRLSSLECTRIGERS